jgi:hypothetical protein
MYQTCVYGCVCVNKIIWVQKGQKGIRGERERKREKEMRGGGEKNIVLAYSSPGHLGDPDLTVLYVYILVLHVYLASGALSSVSFKGEDQCAA